MCNKIIEKVFCVGHCGIFKIAIVLPDGAYDATLLVGGIRYKQQLIFQGGEALIDVSHLPINREILMNINAKLYVLKLTVEK